MGKEKVDCERCPQYCQFNEGLCIYVAAISILKTEENVPSCDKGGHAKRSLFNQPNHKNHWKKTNETH